MTTTDFILQKASSLENKRPKTIFSGIKKFDNTLNGLPLGNISEWGVPAGHQGRQFILCFLANLSRQGGEGNKILWIYPDNDLMIYPPSWLAKGVDLNRVYFAKTNEAIKDLRPVFFGREFKVVVLDSPPVLKTGDLAFLCGRIKCTKQAVFLLRNYFLSPNKGNVFTSRRFNCCGNIKERRFDLKVIKGPSSKKLTLAMALPHSSIL